MLAFSRSMKLKTQRRYSPGFIHSGFRLREMMPLNNYKKIYSSGILPLLSPSYLEKKLRKTAKIQLSDGLCAENAAAAFLHFRKTFEYEWNRLGSLKHVYCQRNQIDENKAYRRNWDAFRTVMLIEDELLSRKRYYIIKAT